MDFAKLIALSEQLQRAEDDLIRVGESLNDAIIKLSLLIPKDYPAPQQQATQPKFAPGDPHPDNPRSIKVQDASKPQSFLETVRAKFPQDLAVMLKFEDKGDYIQVKPAQFLGSENFAKVANNVRARGGEYISAGRDSHFRIYREQ